jgi:hypothetical protein
MSQKLRQPYSSFKFYSVYAWGTHIHVYTIMSLSCLLTLDVFILDSWLQMALVSLYLKYSLQRKMEYTNCRYVLWLILNTGQKSYRY